MDNQEDLTNESVKKNFKSQFELVGYAIKLAENMIKTGRGPKVKSDSQNVAIHILDEIRTGVDTFEDIPKESDEEVEATLFRTHEKKGDSFNKHTEKRRPRKILAD